MARARGRLTKVREDKLEPGAGRYPATRHPGRPLQLGPEIAKEAQRKQVRKALAEGKKVKAVTVRDGCGRQRGDREAHDQDR